MKNVMKLSMLGLVAVGASEMNAMAMTRSMAARGSKLISSHKNLATAGVAAASLFALDLMINKAPVAKAKISAKFAERRYLKAERAFKAGKVAEQIRTDAATAGLEAARKADEVSAASSLYAVRAAKFAGNGFVAGVSKIPGVTTGASKVKSWAQSGTAKVRGFGSSVREAASKVWAKMPSFRRTAPSA